MNSTLAIESERLAELASFEIMDSAPSAPLNALVDSVREMFGVTACAVTMLDDHRVWFKAVAGLDAVQIARDRAFCDHTIQSDSVFVVEDATLDPRFADNGLVTAPPHVRLYAGVPLVVRPGIALGSFCLIDTKPRRLTAEEASLLCRLAVVAFGLIESHKTATQGVRLAAEATLQQYDLMEQRQESSLRDRHFAHVEAIATIGSWTYDLSTKLVSWSDESYRIFDIPPGTDITLELALSIYPEHERLFVRSLMENALTDGTSFDEELDIVTDLGTTKRVRVTGDAEMVGPGARRLYGTVQDITQLRAAESELWQAANHDSLTGLSNRAAFTQHLSDTFRRRTSLSDSTQLGLLMVDVDRLKDLNETLGHAAGDAVLQNVAERLFEAVGQEALVARVGGDEFAITLNGDATEAEAAAVAARLIAAVRRKFAFGRETIAPQVSVGGAVADRNDTADSLRQKAGLALLASKAAGRGGYVAFREEMRASIVRRINMVRHVDEALMAQRVVPFYQPIVRLDTAEIVSLEALARIREPNGTILAAGAFHEALDEHRIAYGLTGQMLPQIAADVRGWLDAGLGFQRVGINATAADFQAGDLRSRLTDSFGTVGVPLKHIVLEVTESVFLDGNEAAVIKAISELRADGMSVSLDDFGTGFASLTHLRSLPVDSIKVDKSFIDGLLVDASSGAIVQALIGLARKLGLSIVAEGIETAEQMEWLRALSWDLDSDPPFVGLGQGFFFARPGDAAATATLLRERAERPGSTLSLPRRRRAP
jgi:diguanylate cyclase (GGDEF)-like protein